MWMYTAVRCAGNWCYLFPKQTFVKSESINIKMTNSKQVHDMIDDTSSDAVREKH